MGSPSNNFYSNSYTKKHSFCYNSLWWIAHQSGESSNLCKGKNRILFLDSAQFRVQFWPSVCPAAEVGVALIKYYFFCGILHKGHANEVRPILAPFSYLLLTPALRTREIVWWKPTTAIHYKEWRELHLPLKVWKHTGSFAPPTTCDTYFKILKFLITVTVQKMVNKVTTADGSHWFEILNLYDGTLYK
jgi:hypothetical protein